MWCEWPSRRQEQLATGRLDPVRLSPMSEVEAAGSSRDSAEFGQCLKHPAKTLLEGQRQVEQLRTIERGRLLETALRAPEPNTPERFVFLLPVNRLHEGGGTGVAEDVWGDEAIHGLVHIVCHTTHIDCYAARV
jgi:hypothetical protein